MEVLFAPDWRDGVPYQRLLAEALTARGTHVSFLQHYKRGLPLWRLCRAQAQARPFRVLHLHWPEAYYPAKGDVWDRWRFTRWPLDLALATRGRVLAVTAHNLQAHNRDGELFGFRNTQAALQRADIVFAHSAVAKDLLVARYTLRPERVHVIAHGDLSVVLGPPHPRVEARARLGLGKSLPTCLIFGAVEPYKGIEEAIAYWSTARPAAELVIVGKPNTPAYGATVTALAEAAPNVSFRPGWLSDEALRDWLSAADAVLFNYRTIFTSGAASLARSFGIPLLLPARLDTVVLDEPTPLVHRFTSFATDFASALTSALNQPPSYAAAAAWRAACAWERVAEASHAAYAQALTTQG